MYEGAESFLDRHAEVDAGNHDKIRAEVVALVVEKTLCVVNDAGDNHQLGFYGILTAVPASFSNDVVRKEEAKNSRVEGRFSSLYAGATGFRIGRQLWWRLPRGFCLLGNPDGTLLRRHFSRETIPVVNELVKYGGLQDVQDAHRLRLVRRICRLMKSSHMRSPLFLSSRRNLSY